ncbi:MAG: hypothetical protein OXP74_03145 [Acidobacteriota bacterium]|nr:hypothetical protein [Acidobacteriota bacterium]
MNDWGLVEWGALAAIASFTVLVLRLEDWWLQRKLAECWRWVLRQRNRALYTAKNWQTKKRGIRSVADWNLATRRELLRLASRDQYNSEHIGSVADMASMIPGTPYKWHEVYIAHQLGMAVSEYCALDTADRKAFMWYFGYSQRIRREMAEQSLETEELEFSEEVVIQSMLERKQRQQEDQGARP